MLLGLTMSNTAVLVQIHVLTLRGLDVRDSKYQDIPFRGLEAVPPSKEKEFLQVLDLLHDNGYDINYQVGLKCLAFLSAPCVMQCAEAP